VDVEGRAVLSEHCGGAQWYTPDRLFAAKIEMDMRCNSVGGEDVGVKCGCMQGCCECTRPGVRFWWCMVQVVVSTQTNRFGAAARQS